MAHSLKTNYLLLALAVVTLLASLLGTLAYYERRIDSSDVNRLTAATVGQNLEADLADRAQKLGLRSAAVLAGTVRSGNKAATRAIAERLLQESDVERVEVSDASGAIVYRGGTQEAPPGEPASATGLGDNATAGGTELGSLRIWMSRAKLDETLAGLHAKLETQQAISGKRVSGGLLALIVLLLALGLTGAWFIARQLSRPISALVKTADRIGQGDYTQPLKVGRQDELGELQSALERMRQKLRETTITKNYLNTVLNSLTDIVLVTSPEGIVRSCNEAAQKLLGYSEEDMIGRPLSGFVDNAH